jgi:3-oxoacyl-[acyl-carrier-protein] synthase II
MGAADDVVITGIGVVSAVGAGLDAYRQAVLQGRSGIRPVTGFKVEDMTVRIAGMLPSLDVEHLFPAEELPKVPRATRMCMLASDEALGPDAKAKVGDGSRVGLVMGVCSGGFDVLDREISLYWDKQYGQMSPDALPGLMDNNAASHIALRFGIHGTAFCLATACATCMDCLGLASDLIRCGRVDAVLAGGGDAAVTRFAMSAFGDARALSRNNDNPSFASRPFDLDRDGFVMGEAAAACSSWSAGQPR